MTELKTTDYLPFDNIKQIDEQQNEFWYARDLQVILEYTNWRNFKVLIEKAMLACNHAGNTVSTLFDVSVKKADLGLGKSKKHQDYELTRYACYLIVQNRNPRKKVIASGQTYFAVQTRKAEEMQALNAEDANMIHHEAGKSIREFLIDLNSTLHENLLKPVKGIQIVEYEEIAKLSNSINVR